MSEFHGGPQGPYQSTNQPIPPHMQQHNVVGGSPLNPNNPQSAGYQKPPKKKHRTRNILIGAGAVLVVILGAAGVGGAGDDKPAGAPAPAVVTPVDNGPTPDPITTPTNKPTAAKTTPPPVPKTTKPAGTACAGQDDRNAPCTVTVGKPFELGKHTVLSGWKTVDEYGTLSITGKAKNTSGETSTMFIDVKFLKGDDVLAVVSCSTNELEPGQTQALSCFGTDSFTKKYNRVTAEASF